MKAMNVLIRLLIVGLALLVLADCHARLPQPGRPTAPQEQLRP
jgi:hypothetical protein